MRRHPTLDDLTRLVRGALVCGVVPLGLAVPAAVAAQVWTSFLPGTSVQAVTRGDSGVVLLATGVGAYRYDGLRFSRLALHAASGDSLSCRAMLQASTGDIWVGTEDVGIYRLRPDGTSIHYTRADGLPHGSSARDAIYALAESADHSVWAATDGGVGWFDGATWSTLDLPGPFIKALTSDPRDGSLWASYINGFQQGGLAHVVGHSVAAVYNTFPTGTANQRIFSIVIARTGDVWVAMQYGLARLTGGVFQSYFGLFGGLADLNSIAEGPGGELWCATNLDGLKRYNGTPALRAYASGQGLASNTVKSVYVDAAGVLWAGTDQGLSRSGVSSWTNFTLDGEPDDRLQYDRNVRSVARDLSSIARGDSIDAYGVTWFGVNNHFSIPPQPSFLARYANGSVAYLAAGLGLPAEVPDAIATDGAGGVWVGASVASGVSIALVRGLAVVRTLSTADRLPDSHVLALRALPGGALWIGTENGAAFFDGTTVRPLPVGPAAVPYRVVRDVDVDPSGHVWIATGESPESPDGAGAGAVRFDPRDSSYVQWSTAQGLPTASLRGVLAATNGDVWFASYSGAIRLRGSSVRVFTVQDGLPSNYVERLQQDPGGRVWAATQGGLAVFDGENWSAYTNLDGMPVAAAVDLAVDSLGVSAALQGGGLTFFQPDRTPPRPVIFDGPPPATGSGHVQFAVGGGDLDTGEQGLLLSYAIDGSRTPFTVGLKSVSLDLSTGTHTFMLWAKDRGLNVSPEPFAWTFVVDDVPPDGHVQRPKDGEVVNGVVSIVGRVSDPRFRSYAALARPVGRAAWDTLVASASAPDSGLADTAQAVLARWDTRAVGDGPWRLRVAVLDSLGLTANHEIDVIVDNVSPTASMTSPADVDHVRGGRVFTTNGEVELDISPDALARDQQVRIDTLPRLPIAAALPAGSRLVSAWVTSAQYQSDLAKPATLILRTTGIAPGEPVTLFTLAADSSLAPLGGTRGADGMVSTTMHGFGAVIAIGGVANATAAFSGVRALECQPRVFSPRGGLLDSRLAISFELGHASSTSVLVYNRAGRLVRRVVESQAFTAGRNVVFWDGRDRNATVVPADMYIVAVLAGSERLVKPVAVVDR